VASLTNDRLGLHPSANEGAYAASPDLKRAHPTLLQHNQKVYGTWRVFNFAQDVNPSPPTRHRKSPSVLIASAIEINFDASLLCPLKAQTNIVVV
jgi:hypothetical protein